MVVPRRELFPHVIELNHQASQRIGCSVYLIHDGPHWALLDIGYEEEAKEFIELVRQLDFPLSQCQTLIALVADVEHIQVLARA